MSVIIREYSDGDISAITSIWNGVVESGDTFPQTQPLDDSSAKAFFSSQSYTGVALVSETPAGLYILHPNNIGRCGHICNASFAVSEAMRGRHIGEALVTDCIAAARRLGFRILQLNAVVATNAPALSLYKKLGFVPLGAIPGGFLMKNGVYEDIIVHYKSL